MSTLRPALPHAPSPGATAPALASPPPQPWEAHSLLQDTDFAVSSPPHERWSLTFLSLLTGLAIIIQDFPQMTSPQVFSDLDICTLQSLYCYVVFVVFVTLRSDVAHP